MPVPVLHHSLKRIIKTHQDLLQDSLQLLATSALPWRSRNLLGECCTRPTWALQFPASKPNLAGDRKLMKEVVMVLVWHGSGEYT